MIYYVILLLAVLTFTAQFAFTKIYSERAEQKLNTTLIMLILISVIGMLLYLFIGGFKLQFSLNSFILAGAFALVMVPYYVLGIKVLSIGSLAIFSMFMMLGGMLLPFAYGLIFLNETLTVGKGIGCVVLSLAIFLQAMLQKEENSKSKNKNLFILLCILIFILNGLTGVIAKAYEITEPQPDEISFTVISCGLTAVLSFLFLIPHITKNKADTKEQLKFVLKPYLFLPIAAIGIATHTGNFLMLKVASDLPASIQFPIGSGGVIVFSAIASVLIFKEKISKGELACVTLAFLSTFLFAF